MNPQFTAAFDRLMEKHGMVDTAFCGVDINDEDISIVDCGGKGESCSNRVRMHRLVGLLGECKFGLLKSCDKKEDESF